MNTRGIGFMVAAMALFAIADTFVKLAADSMSPSQVTFWIVTGSAAIFVALAKAQGHVLLQPGVFSKPVFARVASEIIGTFGMITALSLAPLSTTVAIIQATPLVVTAMAAVVLREEVGWRRWTAIGAGFLGVLLIIRPGGEAFDATLLFAVVAMLGLSGRDFFTRLTPQGLPTTVLSSITLGMVAPFACAWAFIAEGTVAPPGANWLFVGLIILFGTAAYFSITEATRASDLSVVAPFRYSRLIFAGGLGIVVFQETLDGWMVLGTFLILASGLYAMVRERRIAQPLRSVR